MHLEQEVCVLGKSTLYSPFDYTHISKLSLFSLGIAMVFLLDEELYAGSILKYWRPRDACKMKVGPFHMVKSKQFYKEPYLSLQGV